MLLCAHGKHLHAVMAAFWARSSARRYCTLTLKSILHGLSTACETSAFCLLCGCACFLWQEVEDRVFARELQPWFEKRGLQGWYMARQKGEVR